MKNTVPVEQVVTRMDRPLLVRVQDALGELVGTARALPVTSSAAPAPAFWRGAPGSGVCDPVSGVAPLPSHAARTRCACPGQDWASGHRSRGSGGRSPCTGAAWRASRSSPARGVVVEGPANGGAFSCPHSCGTDRRHSHDPCAPSEAARDGRSSMGSSAALTRIQGRISVRESFVNHHIPRTLTETGRGRGSTLVGTDA